MSDAAGGGGGDGAQTADASNVTADAASTSTGDSSNYARQLNAEWTEYKAPDGNLYYHNSVTGESSWTFPNISDAAPAAGALPQASPMDGLADGGDDAAAAGAPAVDDATVRKEDENAWHAAQAMTSPSIQPAGLKRRRSEEDLDSKVEITLEDVKEARNTLRNLRKQFAAADAVLDKRVQADWLLAKRMNNIILHAPSEILDQDRQEDDLGETLTYEEMCDMLVNGYRGHAPAVKTLADMIDMCSKNEWLTGPNQPFMPPSAEAIAVKVIHKLLLDEYTPEKASSLLEGDAPAFLTTMMQDKDWRPTLIQLAEIEKNRGCTVLSYCIEHMVDHQHVPEVVAAPSASANRRVMEKVVNHQIPELARRVEPNVDGIDLFSRFVGFTSHGYLFSRRVLEFLQRSNLADGHVYPHKCRRLLHELDLKVLGREPEKLPARHKAMMHSSLLLQPALEPTIESAVMQISCVGFQLLHEWSQHASSTLAARFVPIESMLIGAKAESLVAPITLLAQGSNLSSVPTELLRSHAVLTCLLTLTCVPRTSLPAALEAQLESHSADILVYVCTGERVGPAFERDKTMFMDIARNCRHEASWTHGTRNDLAHTQRLQQETPLFSMALVYWVRYAFGSRMFLAHCSNLSLVAPDMVAFVESALHHMPQQQHVFEIARSILLFQTTQDGLTTQEQLAVKRLAVKLLVKLMTLGFAVDVLSFMLRVADAGGVDAVDQSLFDCFVDHALNRDVKLSAAFFPPMIAFLARPACQNVFKEPKLKPCIRRFLANAAEQPKVDAAVKVHAKALLNRLQDH